MVKTIRTLSTLLIAVVSLALGLALGWIGRGPRDVDATPLAPAHMTRLAGYQFVRPLLECDIPAVKDPLHFNLLHGDLTNAIERHKTLGNVSHASIYLRDLVTSEAVGISEKEPFSPASLFKVPILIMALKAAERDSGVLATDLKYDLPSWESLPQFIKPTQVLDRGRTYPMRSLLEQMIVESDNHAADVVGGHFGQKRFLQTFVDLGVPVPTEEKLEDFLTVQQYASFFRILYNASYLGPEMSEMALAMLSRVKFMAGLVAGVPATVPVAHKFGERRYLYSDGTPMMQLHDCGVIYKPGRPYLLCLMSRGKDVPTLAGVLHELSAIVFAHYQVHASRVL